MVLVTVASSRRVVPAGFPDDRPVEIMRLDS
jgi:hypothetical protein